MTKGGQPTSSMSSNVRQPLFSAESELPPPARTSRQHIFAGSFGEFFRFNNYELDSA